MSEAQGTGSGAVVVTGATGFIGKRLAPRLRATFPVAPITCLVHERDTGFERTGRRVLDAEGLTTLPVDLVTGRGLDAAPAAPAVVLHLAASTETREPDHRCNDVGTRQLIESLGPLGPQTHVIFTSSMAVTDVRPDYAAPLTDALPDPARPCNEYGRSKLRAERWLKERARADGFRLTILRLGTVHGPDPRPNGMFDSLRRLALRGSWIGRVNWPGRTALIHVDNVVDVILALVGRPPAPGCSDTYILATEYVTLAAISEWIHGALGVPYRPLRLPAWFWAACSAVARRKGALEPLLPGRAYNVLWRLSLIVDHVLWAESGKLGEALPAWRPSRFAEKVGEVVG